jgi:hypothetical protein
VTVERGNIGNTCMSARITNSGRLLLLNIRLTITWQWTVNTLITCAGQTAPSPTILLRYLLLRYQSEVTVAVVARCLATNTSANTATSGQHCLRIYIVRGGCLTKSGQINVYCEGAGSSYVNSW